VETNKVGIPDIFQLSQRKIFSSSSLHFTHFNSSFICKIQSNLISQFSHAKERISKLISELFSANSQVIVDSILLFSEKIKLLTATLDFSSFKIKCLLKSHSSLKKLKYSKLEFFQIITFNLLFNKESS
jgi:hypothetical protein